MKKYAKKYASIRSALQKLTGVVQESNEQNTISSDGKETLQEAKTEIVLEVNKVVQEQVSSPINDLKKDALDNVKEIKSKSDELVNVTRKLEKVTKTTKKTATKKAAPKRTTRRKASARKKTAPAKG
ncbi:hypothetical protein [Algoriphagus sp.]|uniref:hypothetical protein n=1 Tax=Algoriphagus sp. TaxID=1872435 RepID=UPI00257A9E65|nr:hypothetical protein [Algoriphagus sp.]